MIPNSIDRWTEFGSISNKVAAIENAEFLGDLDLKMHVHKGPVRFYQNNPYLSRNFLIKPQVQPSTMVKVRLYITDAEVKGLIDADLRMSSFQKLGVFKYDGPNQDLDLDNNQIQSNNSHFIPASEVMAAQSKIADIGSGPERRKVVNTCHGLKSPLRIGCQPR